MKVLIIALTIFSPLAFSTVTVDNLDCPTQFEGRVKEVIKSVGPSSPFSTQTVIFQNNRTLKGEVKDQLAVEVLQNGPIQVEEGHDYAVQLRSGRVCQIESI